MRRTFTRLKDAALDGWDALRNKEQAHPMPAQQRPITGQVHITEEEDVQDEEEVAEEGYQPHMASPEYHKAIYQSYGVSATGGTHHRIRNIWIKTAAILGTFVIWVVLSLGNAQLFAGFRSFTLDNGIIVLAYVGGFAYEFFGLALIFVAARCYEKKQTGNFAWALGGAIFMAVVSFVCQYLFVGLEFANHAVDIPTQVLKLLPFGIDERSLILLRSIVPTVLEFFIVFLVAEKKYNVEEVIEENRKHQKAIHELELEVARAEQEKIDNDAWLQQKRDFAEYVRTGRQHTRPQQFITYIHDPEQIPEQAASIQQGASQPQAHMPLQRPETVSRQPSQKKASSVPPTQKNVRNESQRVKDNVQRESFAPPPEREVAPLNDTDKLQGMVRIIKKNPSLTMKEIVDLAVPTYGGVQAAYHWYMRARDYLEEEDLPKAVNASVAPQRIPIVQNPRERFSIVDDAEDGGGTYVGEDDNDGENDRPFVGEE